MSDASPTSLTEPQRRLATRLTAECGLDRAGAERLACAYRDEEPVPLMADDRIVAYARKYLGWGVPTGEVADWLLHDGLDSHKRLHIRLGYSADQYAVVGPILEERETEDVHYGGLAEHPRLTSWRNLLANVPPHFLTLAIRARPQGDDEIRRWNDLRLNRDPDIESRLAVQASLLGHGS